MNSKISKPDPRRLSNPAIGEFTHIDNVPLAAAEEAEAWLEAPSLELRAMPQAGRVAGAQVHDARVASLCRLQGVRELWTADRDFGRFPGLNVRNPLVG